MYYLFTTSSCPDCPTAKQYLLEKGVEMVIVDASTPEGLELAQKYSISRAPTLLKVDRHHKAIRTFAGLDIISTLFI